MSKPVLTPSQPQTFEEPDALPSNEFGFLDVLIIIAQNLRLLILAPIVAGALGYGIAYVWPPKYASLAYLTFPLEAEKQTDAFKSAEALMRSPPVLDVTNPKNTVLRNESIPTATIGVSITIVVTCYFLSNGVVSR